MLPVSEIRSSMTVSSVLVVGGGITGCITTIAVAQRDAVTHVEPSARWTGVSHGITVQGDALNVFRGIGVLNPTLPAGHGLDQVRTRNAQGDIDEVLSEYEARRKPRVKFFLESSMQFVDRKIHPDTPGANPDWAFGRSPVTLAVPA